LNQWDCYVTDPLIFFSINFLLIINFSVEAARLGYGELKRISYAIRTKGNISKKLAK